jgi:hypothetical protein
MEIDAWWPRLAEETRRWLIEHNGEPLDSAVRREVVAVNNGVMDPSWWVGESTDGMSELTDGAIDWIEATANAE